MLENNIPSVGHVVIEQKSTGIEAIKLTDDPYNGIIFTYGKVSLPSVEEFMETGEAKLAFEYEIIDNAGIEYDKVEFEQYLGDFLVELIDFGMQNNDITYTGGVDE